MSEHSPDLFGEISPNRNIRMLRFALDLKDRGFTLSEAKSEVLRVNQTMEHPLPESELYALALHRLDKIYAKETT